MKTSATNQIVDEKQELKRFTSAAASLVKRAQKDKSVARKFLSDIGYYTMMSQTSSDQTVVRTDGHTRAVSSVRAVSQASAVKPKSAKVGAMKEKTASAKPASRKAAGNQSVGKIR